MFCAFPQPCGNVLPLWWSWEWALWSWWGCKRLGLLNWEQAAPSPDSPECLVPRISLFFWVLVLFFTFRIHYEVLTKIDTQPLTSASRVMSQIHFKVPKVLYLVIANRKWMTTIYIHLSAYISLHPSSRKAYEIQRVFSPPQGNVKMCYNSSPLTLSGYVCVFLERKYKASTTPSEEPRVSKKN